MWCRTYQREDNTIVTDASQRPSDVEYDRYMWLVEEMKSVNYDDQLLPKVMSFAVEDVFVSAILSVACTVLAEIGEDYKRPHADVRDLYAWAERFRRGVVETLRRTNRRRQGITISGPRSGSPPRPSRSSRRCCAAGCRTTRSARC